MLEDEIIEIARQVAREGLGNEESEMERIEIDIEERLRHEAMVCRNPPVEYVVGEDGGRVVHRPNPDYAMAELLEDAAKVVADLRNALGEMLKLHIAHHNEPTHAKARRILETFK
jgi:hypothetical protein